MHQFYPEFYSGTEKFVLNLSTMIQKLGNQARVITYSFYDDSFYDRSIGQLMLKEFSYQGVPVTAIRHKKMPNGIHHNLLDQGIVETAKDIISNEQPDIVHVGHSMRVNEFIEASRELSIPYIMTLTDFFLICPKVNLITSNGDLCAGSEGGSACLSVCPELPGKVVKRHLNTSKEFLFNANMVISPSKFVASVFKKEYGKLNVKVINHGISYNKIKKNKRGYKKGDKLLFCYAGTLIHHKGVHILLDVFKRLESRDVTLKIYGSGPNETYVNNLMKIAEQDKRIEFCGVFSENQVGSIFSGVDVVILPSLWYENYPLVLHESLACNVPTIVSDVGGLAEKIKDGLNGFTFKIGDGNHLKTVLEGIIKNPEILNELKANIGKIIVPTIEQETYAYESAYKYIVKNSDIRPAKIGDNHINIQSC